ncbi:MAG: hypothetical protein AAFY47_02585, partial [Pseudomonadota bacterium]
FLGKILAVALCGSVFAAPLYAQDDTADAKAENPEADLSGEPQTLLPADMTPDQFIQFFTLFSASEEMEATLDVAVQEMMEPGDPVEDWTSRGIDIWAELETLEGGASQNLLRDLDKEVLGTVDLTGAVEAQWSGFESYALRPEPVGLVAERTFLSFYPGIWFELASQRVQRGTAFCYSGYFGLTLHTKRTYTQWSEKELLTIATVFALADRMAAREFCAFYNKVGERRYTTTALLPDGRDLPMLNSEQTIGVPMPRRELEKFLNQVPSASPAQPPANE